MYQARKPIGILGGTFDPIHIGHLRLALEAYEALKLEKVHIIPCYQPVHRELPVATPKQRLEMVELSVIEEPALFCDDREISRKAPSYSMDTLIDFHREMPHTPLCLIIGIDAFLGFASWHRYREIFDLAHVIVAHRPQYQLPTTGIIADIIKQHLQHDIAYLHENTAQALFLLPITELDISASDIRKQIAIGRNPRYLLPDSVYDYIRQHHIYKYKSD